MGHQHLQFDLYYRNLQLPKRGKQALNYALENISNLKFYHFIYMFVRTKREAKDVFADF